MPSNIGQQMSRKTDVGKCVRFYAQQPADWALDAGRQNCRSGVDRRWSELAKCIRNQRSRCRRRLILWLVSLPQSRLGGLLGNWLVSWACATRGIRDQASVVRFLQPARTLGVVLGGDTLSEHIDRPCVRDQPILDF